MISSPPQSPAFGVDVKSNAELLSNESRASKPKNDNASYSIAIPHPLASPLQRGGSEKNVKCKV